MSTLNRYTNGTIQVDRLNGKIALEEAVGSAHWDAYQTYPVTNQIYGYDGVPFDKSIGADIIERLTDVPARLASMDDSGIGYVIVSLTSPGIEGVFDPANATAFARQANNEMYTNYVQPYPDRFGFFASVPMQDPTAAAAELERAVTQLGALGALINGYAQLGTPANHTVRYLDDPACAPFWAKVAELDVPVYLHPRPPPPSQQQLYHGYPMLAHAAYGFGAETAGHALRLMLSGLFDRHPSVRVVLGHCAEALPFLAHRVDQRLLIGVPGADGPHQRSVRYYLRNNFYATLAGVRRLSTVRDTIEEMGEDRVLWSVDYPYESNEDAADWKKRDSSLVSVLDKYAILWPLGCAETLRLGGGLSERPAQNET
ncbi:hypothetical protein GTA08_BOTSDO03419 [Neofusicoccum parvum]|uniref:Uncharacterized protein n=1 Tax=Neofusicoccum parvum TaxID=310453 RepID=A0ACB5RXF5_9PEZI|nr:hypothetical protein GTA08_BOTSDO03419 [Neofusicoccum parvum]